MYCFFFSARNSHFSPGFPFQSCIVLIEEEVISGLVVRNIWGDCWLRHNPALFLQKFLLTLHVMLSFYYLIYFLFLVRHIRFLLMLYFHGDTFLMLCMEIFDSCHYLWRFSAEIIIFVSFGIYIWERAKGGSDKSISLRRETLWFQSCSYLIRSCFSLWLFHTNILLWCSFSIHIIKIYHQNI